LLEHEYTMLGGVSRANVGRYLSVISAAVSATCVFLLLWGVNFCGSSGGASQPSPSIFSLVGAGIVFTVLYWLLNHHAWKWPGVSRSLKIPDLSGEWRVDGHSLNPDITPSCNWQGNITIVQTWDKLRVYLKTDQSRSNSKSAALLHDEPAGYRRFYNYQNEPKIGEPELVGHRGFCEITFAPDLQSGEGNYFNGHGRFTFGTMKLRRA
jgi:hypothetical protein